MQHHKYANSYTFPSKSRKKWYKSLTCNVLSVWGHKQNDVKHFLASYLSVLFVSTNNENGRRYQLIIASIIVISFNFAH
jgi:hypothetical protein